MTSSNTNERALVKSRVEPTMDFFSNFSWQGWRWRVFGSRFFYRPLKETFAEFLDYHTKLILAEKWWREQENKHEDNQHIVYRWAKNYHQAAKSNQFLDQTELADGSISFIPSGPILAWLSFGYDLLCLFHKKILPTKLIKRLRQHDEFQGAWFEVAAAASILRAGCDVAWINDSSKRNCEFLATHKLTKIQFGVEAKSKRRPKVYNHDGAYNSSSSSCASLVEDALGQAPSSLPFILFVDINIPTAINTPPLQKPILNEVKRLIEAMDVSTPEKPDKFSLLLATSFGFHYGDMNTPAYPHEHCDVIPQYTKYPLHTSVFNDINASIRRYGLIPEEV